MCPSLEELCYYFRCRFLKEATLTWCRTWTADTGVAFSGLSYPLFSTVLTIQNLTKKRSDSRYPILNSFIPRFITSSTEPQLALTALNDIAYWLFSSLMCLRVYVCLHACYGMARLGMAWHMAWHMAYLHVSVFSCGREFACACVPWGGRW